MKDSLVDRVTIVIPTFQDWETIGLLLPLLDRASVTRG